MEDLSSRQASHRQTLAMPFLSRQLGEQDWTLPYLVFASDNLQLNDNELKEEFESARRNARQIYVLEKRGPILQCFANVEIVVRKLGGRAVFGWQVIPNTLDEQAGIEMETHAVWESPEGELVEVTEGLGCWLFAPSSRVKDETVGCVLSCTQPTAKLAAFVHHQTGKQVSVVKNSLATLNSSIMR